MSFLLQHCCSIANKGATVLLSPLFLSFPLLLLAFPLPFLAFPLLFLSFLLPFLAFLLPFLAFPPVFYAATLLQPLPSLSPADLRSHPVQLQAHLPCQGQALVLVGPGGKNQEPAFCAGLIVLMPRL